MQVKIIFHQTAEYIHERDIDSSEIPFYVPQIGATFVLINEVYTVGNIKYDLDYGVIKVYSKAYLLEAERRQREWEEAERRAMDSHPRNTYGNNCPHLRDRLLEV